MRLSIFLALAPMLCAQAPLPRRVQAIGTASLTITPDQARLTVGVVTSAPLAVDAAAQNATEVAKVIAAVTQLIGTKGSIKTSSYSVSPNYRTVPGQTPPQLVGYTASNTLEVRVNDLNLTGQLIDTAVQAGANSVGGPQFTLQDPEPVRLQALAAAGRQARAHADSIASGLGGRTGQVITAQEGASFLPVDRTVAVGAATPIVPGNLEISATVTIDVELQ